MLVKHLNREACLLEVNLFWGGMGISKTFLLLFFLLLTTQAYFVGEYATFLNETYTFCSGIRVNAYTFSFTYIL